MAVSRPRMFKISRIPEFQQQNMLISAQIPSDTWVQRACLSASSLARFATRLSSCHFMHSQWGEIWLWRKGILFTFTITDETYAASLTDRVYYLHV
jgi:hypothetical protein